MSRQDRKIENFTKVSVEPTEQDASENVKKPRTKRTLGITGAAIALLALANFGYDYWTNGRFLIETDDAYVTADTTVISSRVQGYVVDVPVEQNGSVQAGDVLIKLDDGDYQIALDTAVQHVEIADKTIARIGAQIKAAQASVEQSKAMKAVAEATMRAAQRDFDRSQTLADNNIASQASLDNATEQLETATASLASSDAAILNAEAQVSVLQAQQAEAAGNKHELELAVKQAQRNLDLTILRAPADGTVGNLAVEVGDLVTPGSSLAALVPMNALYIEANFKETQIHGVATGADVHIAFDAIPDTVFEGQVTSVSPATGSVFSLLPADNATGNFTKIVQRVPVRIAVPKDALESGYLRAGLSAVVEVDSRTGTPTHVVAQAE